jgi:hypothetical protein
VICNGYSNNTRQYFTCVGFLSFSRVKKLESMVIIDIGVMNIAVKART